MTATSLADAKKQGAVLAWGSFLTIALNFLIIAWALFLVVKGMNRLKMKEAMSPTAAPNRQEVLLTLMSDLLAKK